MLGAIIGDIVGSIYEPKDSRIKTKDFLFSVRTVVSQMIRFARLLSLILSYTISRQPRRCESGGSGIRGVVSVKYLKTGSIPRRMHPTALSVTVRRCASHQRRSEPR